MIQREMKDQGSVQTMVEGKGRSEVMITRGRTYLPRWQLLPAKNILEHIIRGTLLWIQKMVCDRPYMGMFIKIERWREIWKFIWIGDLVSKASGKPQLWRK